MAHSRRRGIYDMGDGFVAVYAEYELKDEIKGLPGAKWDPYYRCWMVPAFVRREAEAILAGTATEPSNFGRGSSWAQDMFDALPVHLHEPVYRALAKVLHPDVGGDTQAAQALIAAFSKRRAA